MVTGLLAKITSQPMIFSTLQATNFKSNIGFTGIYSGRVAKKVKLTIQEPSIEINTKRIIQRSDSNQKHRYM